MFFIFSFLSFVIFQRKRCIIFKNENNRQKNGIYYSVFFFQSLFSGLGFDMCKSVKLKKKKSTNNNNDDNNNDLVVAHLF